MEYGYNKDGHDKEGEAQEPDNSYRPERGNGLSPRFLFSHPRFYASSKGGKAF
jgi:hypothetical protein